MSVVPAGHGRKLITEQQEITFKVTGADGSVMSFFEVMVPPGFDVGAHVHHHSQEFFYVLKGELELLAFEPTERTTDSWHDWQSPEGARALRGGPGSCMFVPSDTPHAFRNRSEEPAVMLFGSYPAPDHENYFDEIVEIFSSGRSVDAQAIQKLRDRYDVDQITPLRYQPPTVS